jgi:UDP-N-acetylglucosamine 1-carboxyvinyltransferase
MSASLLTDEPVVLKNVPDLADIRTFIELLRNHGAKVEWDKENATLRLHAPKITSIKAPYGIVSKMRASIYILGALLGRCGEAKVSAPGGCSLGQRAINLHIEAMQSLGAKVELHHGYIVAVAPEDGGGRKRLRGATVNGLVRVQDGVVITTHGGTVNAIEAAVLAKGETVIEYASMEPEVDDLINMLNKMGAKISRVRRGAANLIKIDGVERLSGCEYSVMPDRLEAGTYAIAAIITGGEVEIENADASKLLIVLDKLQQAGAKITLTPSGFIADGRGVKLKAVDIAAEPYPGFPTDLQPQFMALMSVASGTSTVKENLFENRLMYVPELVRMCAEISVTGENFAEFSGVPKLCGADVAVSDIRAGAALTIAGLVAEGETVLHKVRHIYRGYQNFVGNLRALGADITVETED